MARRGLEADEWLRLGSRPHPSDIVAHLRDPARVAGGADFLEQPHGRELGIGREPSGDDPGEGIELGAPRRVLPGRRGGDVAGELAGRDPVVHDAPAHAKALGDGGLRETVIEEMLK